MATPADTMLNSLYALVQTQGEQIAALQSTIGELTSQFAALRQPPSPTPQEEPLPSTSTTVPPFSIKPKAPTPKPYDGKADGLESWLSRMRSLISYMPTVSLYDRTGVEYAILHLEGQALEVMDARVRETGDTCAGCDNWLEFAQLLRDYFGPADPDITGRAKLRVLKQTGSVQQYTDAFLKLIRSMRSPPADLDQRELYIGGLKENPQAYVRGQFPKDLRTATTIALLWDKTLYPIMSDKRPKATSPAVTSSTATPMDLGAIQAQPKKPQPKPKPKPHAPASSALPKLSKLTPEERKRCDELGLCYRCREGKHFAAECPRFAKN